MKNNKNLRTIFNLIPVICSAMLVIFLLFWVNSGQFSIVNAKAQVNYSSLWTQDSDGNVAINWPIGGVYLAVILIALSFSIFNLIEFVIPGKNKVQLTLIICNLVALVGIIIAMFMPYCLKWNEIDEQDKAKHFAVAVQCLFYMGTPLFAVVSTANSLIEFRANK